MIAAQGFRLSARATLLGLRDAQGVAAETRPPVLPSRLQCWRQLELPFGVRLAAARPSVRTG